jgi:hypothetical protein
MFEFTIRNYQELGRLVVLKFLNYSSLILVCFTQHNAVKDVQNQWFCAEKSG